MLEFIRIACAVPPVQVGNPQKNTRDICKFLEMADEKAADLVLFPEMTLSGYTCADLFFQETLLKGCLDGLEEILRCSARFPGLTAVVGAPLVIGGQMYNCGIVLSGGEIQGIVPKTYLPNYNEFYERRWFSSARDMQEKWVSADELGLSGDKRYPVGADMVFRLGDGVLLGVEVCEDLWTPLPPSTLLSLNGAEVIVNLSASNETVGKREYRRELVKHQSAICNCIYAYTSAGSTESTQDLVFSGHSMIAENGDVLAENQDQIATDYLLVYDADVGQVRSQRRRNKSVRDATSFFGDVEPVRTVHCGGSPLRSDGSLRKIDRLPFVPGEQANRLERCQSIFSIQVAGLKHRLASIGNAKAILGVSGGLDSTLALLVAVEAMRQLGRPASDVHAITMPCFGTSGRTYRNSWELMKLLGVTCKEISIADAVTGHFRDIGHDPAIHNGTYENAQARERTQVLMDYAGMVGGIVVGTGDLSELALGWCTYNGDHMSMYGVNASIPKTLLRWMIEALSTAPAFLNAQAVLRDILDTPISPELLPPDDSGNIAQSTEELVGPYVLHDFFLYYTLRFGFSPKKVYFLACQAFRGEFDATTIRKWLKFFYRRFFSQQFKRSCMPDGVKVGSVSLNPRGDWRMPSDATARLWLDEVDALE